MFKVFKGLGVSPGIIIGKAYIISKSDAPILRQGIKSSSIENEIKRFKDAVSASINQLIHIKKNAKYDVVSKHLFIFDTHLMILRDNVFINDIVESIRERKITAEWAVEKFLTRYKKLFEKVGDNFFKGKNSDIDHIGIRLINNLTGHSIESMSSIREPVIVIAHDLSPSDTIQMNKKYIQGFATNEGGKASHTGILAAALNIPAIVALKNITSRVSNGDPVVMDGNEGIIIIRPSKETFKKYLRKQQKYKYYEQQVLKYKDLPSETKDGFKLRLMANIGYSDEVAGVLKYGADGIGLYRTEYHYMNKKRLPREEDLFIDYKKVVESIHPMPVTIRTMDFGGDKDLPYLKVAQHTNTALGLRGIRWSLSQVKIFKTQLRGILRASAYGNIKIMYPMISCVEEVDRAAEILEEIKHEFEHRGIPFAENIKTGILIEIPSAAIIADILAKKVDFLSIGTNDLIQYSIAVDRGNEEVSYLYQPFHPSILRLLKGVILAANNEGIEVAVCGQMGGRPDGILLLLGLGNITMLSMDRQSIPKIRRLIQLITKDEAKHISDQAINLSSAKEVNNLVESFMQEGVADELKWESIIKGYKKQN